MFKMNCLTWGVLDRKSVACITWQAEGLELRRKISNIVICTLQEMVSRLQLLTRGPALVDYCMCDLSFIPAIKKKP